MPIQVKHESVGPFGTATFKFDAPVLSWVVGIAYWRFQITASGDHHVLNLALSLSTNQIGNIVTCGVNATLSDSSHHINTSSSVVVCCVALVSAPNTTLVLANTPGVSNGQSSPPIALPDSNMQLRAAFLSGFNLSYGSSTHHVQKVWASAGFVFNGTAGSLTAEVGMRDADGHQAQTATINGGVIAATDAEPGFFVDVFTGQATSPTVMTFPKPIKEAVVLLQKITVQYPGGGHHVRYLGGGTADWTVEGSKVTLYGAYAFMADDSNHEADDKTSSVTVLVVAVPVPAPVPVPVPEPTA